MIGAISGVNTYMPVQSARGVGGLGNLWHAQRPANTGTAVQPVTPVRPVDQVSQNQRRVLRPELPPVRQGADPVEMAVRMRIQYLQPGQEAQNTAPMPGAQGTQNTPAMAGASAQGTANAMPMPGSAAGGAGNAAPMPGTSAQGAQNAMLMPGASAQGAAMGMPGMPGEGGGQSAVEAKGGMGAGDVQKTAEEGRCETCDKRKYQDGSDDPGVSFKTPTNIAPEQAASAVRGHEMQHVVREQAKATREDRKVVSQSVTYHTSICPECGKAYVSGGTTRTVTAANTQPQQPAQDKTQGQSAGPMGTVA